jgi:glycosyltransferase involved in cell wall biosynthesis
MSTLHVISLPHTQTTKAYLTCAYTQKVVKFGKMMTGRDRKVIIYSGEYNEAPCDEHVQLISEDERAGWFGKYGEEDLERGGFDWNSASPWWVTMNERAIEAIKERCETKDLLLILAGHCQKSVSDAIPFLTACEWAVGYEGVYTGFCAYESAAWMHYLYGKRDMGDGRFYDAVIPNYFDPAEFIQLPPASRYPQEEFKGEYLLYVGRLVQRKGVHIAGLISERLGIPLVIAGQGGLEWGDGWVKYPEGEVRAPGLKFVGPVNVEQRAELMANATALLAPTTYIGPFEGVAVEAMMSGCPAVTTDWGAFRETVEEGVTGYRFRTLQQGCDAVLKAAELDRKKIQRTANKRYSLKAVAPMFDRWFDQLDGLWGKGWDA